CFGELLQVDATPFPWFGGKEKSALHAFIDDARGMITGLYLCKNECLRVLKLQFYNFVLILLNIGYLCPVFDICGSLP
ncbi:MAG: hypothetical protein P1P67_05620, partial [Treponema phagedenis]